MMSYKEYIAASLEGRLVRMKCDCIINLDVSGRVIGHIISNNEIIYKISTGKHTIQVGENTPDLQIEIIE